MSRLPLTRDQLSRLDAAIARAQAEANRNPLPHPDDARPNLTRWPTPREIETAVLRERARLARQYPHANGEAMPPPGLVASARLP
jgi:hypothetical protein